MTSFWELFKHKKQHSNILQKISVRKWIINYFEYRYVLDIYGSYGALYENIWKNNVDKYEGSEGDVFDYLNKADFLEHNIFDIDPYGSPFEVLNIINQKATQNRIGFVCTDGYLRRQGMIRGKLSKLIMAKCELDYKDKKLMAAIYYQYPAFLSFILSQIMDNYDKIENMIIKYGKRGALAYFGVIMLR